ncbi:MAG: ferredoxin [Janthinobacterium lividum]
METMLKVIIKKGACCGYGVCAEICPDVYKLDDNGIVYLENDLVPAALAEQAREGAAACPQSALSTEPVPA